MTSYRYHEQTVGTFFERLLVDRCTEFQNTGWMNLRVRELERINSWELTIGEQGEMDMLKEKLKNNNQ